MTINRRFVEFVATLLIVFAFIYFFWASFYNKPNYNKELIASIKDFLQNALLIVIGYFFGSSIKGTVEK